MVRHRSLHVCTLPTLVWWSTKTSQCKKCLQIHPKSANTQLSTSVSSVYAAETNQLGLNCSTAGLQRHTLYIVEFSIQLWLMCSVAGSIRCAVFLRFVYPCTCLHSPSACIVWLIGLYTHSSHMYMYIQWSSPNGAIGGQHYGQLLQCVSSLVPRLSPYHMHVNI